MLCSQAFLPPSFLIPQGLSSAVWGRPAFMVAQSPLGLSEFSKTQKFPETNPVTGYGRILKHLVIGQGAIEFLLLLLCLFLFFLIPSSPFGFPNGFGEDIVSPIQIHDPILQVEFPFVLTSVNLQKEMNNVGVKSRQDTVSSYGGTLPDVFILCNSETVTSVWWYFLTPN